MCRSGGSRIAGLALLALLAGAGRAQAQLGSLISPGRLSAAHAQLEGAGNCAKCHEQGRKVTAQKCLACHAPIAERIARKVGVHRSVTTDCVACHAEHAGVDGVLRPFDTAKFDHATSGFPLDGKHAPLAGKCDACHKTRSFLALRPACATCHTDVHKGTLGPTCTSCHSTRTAFRVLSGQFDHAKSAFPLVGAHRSVPCASCHVNRTFKGLKFGACSDCHRDPHRQSFGPTCTTCHSSDAWRTTRIDHARTGFTLKGRHAAVSCASCHRQPAMKVKLRSETCAACHVDVHKGAFKKDCSACHSESGFGNTPFDHSQTPFALTGMHAGLACSKCHKSVTVGTPARRPAARAAASPVISADFRGLTGTCTSCHTDVHRGELGPRCDSCHSPSTFHLASFTHPRFAEFFGGSHETVACAKCHSSDGRMHFTDIGTSCATCHQDVHLGQLGPKCESCHSIAAPAFTTTSFSHAATRFALTGRHAAVPCVQCHKRETGAFPAGQGSAVRFANVGVECRTCHADIHLGQFASTCETCHTTSGFALPGYRHRTAPLPGFFAGRHAKAPCSACHKPRTGAFPGGTGTAVLFRADPACATCHTDVHRGSLGNNCIECHRP